MLNSFQRDGLGFVRVCFGWAASGNAQDFLEITIGSTVLRLERKGKITLLELLLICQKTPLRHALPWSRLGWGAYTVLTLTVFTFTMPFQLVNPLGKVSQELLP